MVKARRRPLLRTPPPFSSGLPRQAPAPSSGLAGRTDLRIQKSLLCSVISALILLYAKSDVDIIRGPHPQKTNGTIKNMGKRRETHERSPKGAACISAFGLLVLDVKHWTGNRIDFASVSTDLLSHEADIGDRECREGQGQQTDQVGPDKQQTLSQRQIAAQCADQLCV